jgi:hypothetical protein
VLGREVQTTGVAPTDDRFTVIAPGAEDTDRDGPSFIGDPGLGFGPLRVFGPQFMTHFQLKVRRDLATESILLVDSPGMIDAPAALSTRGFGGGGYGSGGGYSSDGGGGGDRAIATERYDDRGYDFLGVTRWLAEHADVILLFFDPDKPGTTGETLECLTSALSGKEHKLHIVMNKVDQFVHIHDFARAYGSLCWNLSKVVPRKDLPRIYTMFLPPEARSGSGRLPEVESPAESSLAHALAELSSTRDEVLHAVRTAPERRIDNLITRAHDACALLRMHSVVLEEARRLYSSLRLRWISFVGVLAAASPAASYAAYAHLDVAAQYAGAIGGAFSLAAAIAGVQARSALLAEQANLLSDSGLDKIFNRLHSVEVSERDEYVRSLWMRARPQLRSAIGAIELHALEKLSSEELEQLDQILQQRVPELRKLTSAHAATAPASAAYVPPSHADEPASFASTRVTQQD